MKYLILYQNKYLAIFLDYNMVKLYSLSVLLKEAKVKTLASAYDLQSFGYFQRSRFVNTGFMPFYFGVFY